MSDIAEISVIATGSVALGVPFINGFVTVWQQSRLARIQRYDELRSVLDDAARALMAFTHVVPVDAVKPDGSLDMSMVAERVPQMRDALKRIWEQEARIAVRRGTASGLYNAHHRAHDAAGAEYSYFRNVVGGTPTTTPLAQLLHEQARSFGVFFDLAAATIGPDRK